MRILILGGTEFIGRAITEHMAAHGDEVMVVHRGQHEPTGLPATRHLHADRRELADHGAAVADFAPEAAVEVYAMNGAQAAPALAVLPEGIPVVAISSGDVYRAYESIHSGLQTDALPLAESAPLRQRRFLDGPEYENLEVEQAYRARGATVLRLGAVYGPHDSQRRFDFVLDRVRAGRKRIPIGAGTFLFSKVYVHDVASAVRLALTTPATAGRTYNIAEAATAGFDWLARRVLHLAGSDAELVTVPDAVLPPDLAITRAVSQDMLMDASAARAELGWRETNPDEAMRRAVAWYLAHPSSSPSDFTADDAALPAA